MAYMEDTDKKLAMILIGAYSVLLGFSVVPFVMGTGAVSMMVHVVLSLAIAALVGSVFYKGVFVRRLEHLFTS